MNKVHIAFIAVWLARKRRMTSTKSTRAQPREGRRWVLYGLMVEVLWGMELVCLVSVPYERESEEVGLDAHRGSRMGRTFGITRTQ